MHITIGGFAHSLHLNSLEHCVSTAMMPHIRPSWDSSVVGLPGAYVQMLEQNNSSSLVERAKICERMNHFLNYDVI